MYSLHTSVHRLLVSICFTCMYEYTIVSIEHRSQRSVFVFCRFPCGHVMDPEDRSRHASAGCATKWPRRCWRLRVRREWPRGYSAGRSRGLRDPFHDWRRTWLPSRLLVCYLWIIIDTFANEEHDWTVTSSGRKVLDNSKGLDVISLLVKYEYYLPLAHINKVIKLFKFKSAMNLQCF